MDDTLCQLFFEHPACPAQRQYEALRAAFIDGLSQKDAAERFGYAPDAFLQLVHQFRLDRAAGIPPPFSPLMAAGDPRGRPSSRPHGPTPPIAPTCAS
jgi:hypothetical protein